MSFPYFEMNFNFSEQLKSVKIETNTNGIKPAPKVKDVIGNSLSRIGPYKKLDNKKQVVALIDDVSCLNCENNFKVLFFT